MKPEKVDRHIDTDCPGEPRPQPLQQQTPHKSQRYGFTTTHSIDSKSTKAPERLPSLNYSLLKDNALRKRLSDIGISTWGSRQLLEKRHKEWVMLWNANCDSLRPKTRTELLRDLDTWERTQGGHASLVSQSANLGAQIKDKEFDGAGWSTKHSDSFKDLIANARMSRMKAEQKPQEPNPSTEGTRPQDPPLINERSSDLPPVVMTSRHAPFEHQTLTNSGPVIDLAIQSNRPQQNPLPDPPAGSTTGPLAENIVLDSTFARTTTSS